MIIQRLKRHSPQSVLGVVLVVTVCVTSTIGQPTKPDLMPAGHGQQHTIPIEHLYWHFLLHQHQLDQFAAEREAKGLNGSGMRTHLQRALGWKDSDYSPVRLSSGRLTSEMKELDAQAAKVRAGGPSTTGASQLKALADQRETKINAEVAYLRHTLPPDKTKALEAFMTEFFLHTSTAVQK